MRKFIPISDIDGDTVGSAEMGVYGFIHAELPNPDVDPEQRIIRLRIENNSDYKSISRADLDSGVKSGANELVILCEYQTRGLFGRLKPCIHVAWGLSCGDVAGLL